MQIFFIECKQNIFGGISYETYYLQVSLSKKLILPQFSQKKNIVFFNKNSKKKENKNRNPNCGSSPPHLFQKFSLMNLCWGEDKIFL